MFVSFMQHDYSVDIINSYSIVHLITKNIWDLWYRYCSEWETSKKFTSDILGRISSSFLSPPSPLAKPYISKRKEDQILGSHF
jgi:hypothetical protein